MRANHSKIIDSIDIVKQTLQQLRNFDHPSMLKMNFNDIQSIMESKTIPKISNFVKFKQTQQEELKKAINNFEQTMQEEHLSLTVEEKQNYYKCFMDALTPQQQKK